MSNTLGQVTIGDVFIYTKDPELNGKDEEFEGDVFTVVSFMPAEYKNRVKLKTDSGKEVLFPEDVTVRAQDRADANMKFINLTLAANRATAVGLDGHRIKGMAIKDGVTVLTLFAPNDTIPVKETPEQIAAKVDTDAIRAVVKKLRQPPSVDQLIPPDEE